MKNYYVLYFISFLFIINLRAQSDLNTEQINFYQSKAQSSSFFTVTEDMVQQILKSVASERETILTILEQMYPGLKEQMEKDLQTLNNVKDSAKFEALFMNFEKDYNSKLYEVWSRAGIKDENLRNKYTDILGNIAFSVGQFGGIIIRNQITEAEPPIDRDNFTVVFCGGHYQNSLTGDCFGGAQSIFSGRDDHFTRLFINSQSQEEGSCNFIFNKGCNLTINEKEYKYLVARFTQESSYIELRAIGLYGLSTAESTVSIYIESEGVNIKRDIAQVIAIAPLFYSSARIETQIPLTATVAIYNPYKLPAQEYKIYRRLNSKISTGGFGDIANANNVVRMQGILLLTLIK